MIPHLALSHLRCPTTGGVLEWMSSEQLSAVHREIAASSLVNRSGDLVTEEPSAMLVCKAARLAYPILRGIPLLTTGEAIDLGQLAETS